jgi:hypothetical protein
MFVLLAGATSYAVALVVVYLLLRLSAWVLFR